MMQELPWHDIPPGKPSAVALGVFDGVHLGHRAIIRCLVESARSRNLKAVVFSFSNHPRSVLKTTGPPPPRLLMSAQRRSEMLLKLGVDQVLMPAFTHAWATTDPTFFAREFLGGVLSAEHVVVGFNYRFGHRGEGKPDHLVRHGQVCGYTVEVMPPLEIDGSGVSSTRIREALQSHQIVLANRLLGHPHELLGQVVHGYQLGREFGYPTANLQTDLVPLLPPGVYAVRVYAEEGNRPLAGGMFFYGPRKTFRNWETTNTCEVHLLDWSGDLYDRRLRLEILDWVRSPVTFDTPEKLRQQLAEDMLCCRRILNGIGPSDGQPHGPDGCQGC